MTHLVGSYPTPPLFKEAVEAMLTYPIDYLEIQLPFTNPMADGPVIYAANQKALEHHLSLPELLATVHEVQTQTKSSTKLLLMSYLTPIFAVGLEHVAKLLSENGFSGMIIPDLIYGSAEQKQLSTLCTTYNLQLVPVLSPRTTPNRFQTIISHLQPGQAVYATARTGTTGSSTALENDEVTTYLDHLQTQLQGFDIAVGFGIKDANQVAFLNQRGIVAVIGSEIVRRISAAYEQNQSPAQAVTTFLSEVS